MRTSLIGECWPEGHREKRAATKRAPAQMRGAHVIDLPAYIRYDGAVLPSSPALVARFVRNLRPLARERGWQPAVFGASRVGAEGGLDQIEGGPA
ncbi:hypothetical protein [Flexivirga meconopsidis]|uniref:hypothetical protein n=1 Tax=Flexivirga meconopsidis TaxID=2977121 RepID=UPI002240AF06|nr:hypothetical protein [Flexivirga meconopsidis]